ncbi:hypothetical protein MH117_05790 [Paenibacillus sp. ACRRX]|uniref:hypothetical protein n=1 Tax=unclassified Paenibacillus TaxID=185978 RepID=UPI001EF6A990|nr:MULTISPECIES: hypothetical protein [unclassified Paenibacillus]MCG7406924.1 hypothetical protein [Paenibacillus sp. ACRRX]MDK8179858.1 hypothetical protein [Paenibacillus sp. UMB4589-SE434]
MHSIPVVEANIRSYIGKTIWAVQQDGTCIYGTVTDVRDGKLYFRDSFKGAQTVPTGRTKAKARLSQLRDKASVSSFFPCCGFGGGGFIISLAFIALLFACPFFGFPFLI